MDDLKKHGLLLSLLSLLIFAKFILVPIFAWQDEILLDIKNKEKRLNKITRVLSNESQVTLINEKLAAELLKAESLFYPFQSESAFKLAQQQMFEVLLSKHELVSSNFGWQTAVQLDDYQLKRYQLQIRLNGKTKNIVNFFTALESYDKRIEIKDFNISLRGQNTESSGWSKGARIVLNLYVNNAVKGNAA